MLECGVGAVRRLRKYHMKDSQFVPPKGAFTRTVPIRFSHCDPAGIVYFPHYFDMFNGLIEDWLHRATRRELCEAHTGRPARFSFRSHRNRFQIAEPDGGAAGSYFVARTRRAFFAERHHRRSFGWCREIARAIDDRDDVLGDTALSRVAPYIA